MTFESVRRDLIAACLHLADKGYLAGTGGNVACRIDEEHFAITPSASDYYALNAADICVLRLSDLQQVAGDKRPSVEHKLHAHLLRARRDCVASIHTHQPIASAYTLLGRDLEFDLPAYRAALGPKALCVGYAPSGTAWLASKLRKSLRPDINAYFLRNHGVVCCGPSLREAAQRVDMLERACSEFFRSAIQNRQISGAEAWTREALSLLVPNPELENRP
ncbi:class II aldolase/adducin family protein [Occallatibacter riparius]|uniref:Class II aldolase/adducin family protein n=1 Tax=Occallatibacter riparius TaxID=1002689 RepID=A0A9J7BH40_9BACT|nr:class II aldolase/adducin family protein [Occallatibacter riparius]UWZ82292.1 class II aldolase/adducin family protein [Occallatibacter riparius]